MAATATMSLPASHSVPYSLVAGPTSKRTKSIRVPPKISIGDINPNNIGTLRKLNSVLFPVAYSDRFYKEVLAPEVDDYCKLVFYNDIPVGAICCRIERESTSTNSDNAPAQPSGKLYLMTLGVLAPYRRQGLASQLLSHVITKATEASLAASLTPPPSSAPAKPVPSKTAAKGKGKAADPASTASETATPALAAPILKSIFVHVQVNNDDARTFWLEKGFKETETIKDYYKPTIEGPRDAWLLEREITI